MQRSCRSASEEPAGRGRLLTVRRPERFRILCGTRYLPAPAVAPDGPERRQAPGSSFRPAPSGLHPQPESPRRKAEDEYAGHDAVQDAEKYGHQTEYQRGHSDLHQEKADEIRDQQDNLIRSALHLRTGVVRLKQIINRQIVDRKKDAQADDRYEKYRVIQRIRCPSGDEKQQGQPGSDDSGGQQIHLDNFPQTDLKQLQDGFRLFIESIGQQAVIAVHEQHPGKSGSSVDGVHDKDEIRQICQKHAVCHRFRLRPHKKRQTGETDQSGTDSRNPLRGFP